MFDKNTLYALLILAAIWAFAKWLTADRPLKWVPRVLMGGRK